MISNDEILILKNLIVGKSLRELSNLIGYESLSCHADLTVDVILWNEIESEVISTYIQNIQDVNFGKLRKRIELSNAKSGFVIPQEKLLARELIKKEEKRKKTSLIINKSNRSIGKNSYPDTKKDYTELSRKKNKRQELTYKKKILEYFQMIEYQLQISSANHRKASYNDIKECLKRLFSKYDPITSDKIDKARSYMSLFGCLPVDQRKTKDICKHLLVERHKNAQTSYYYYESKSVRLIYTPMGGMNR